MDSDFQAVTEQLLQAIRAGEPAEGAMARLCPDIVAQLESDRLQPGMLSLWGRCENVDEITKSTIVSPAVVDSIHSFAGLGLFDPAGGFPHAGLQHTYGYLFSAIETPFGWKRDRWVKPDLERCLGLNRPVLRPWPHAGSLLANATYFLGRVAFTRCRRELSVLRQFRDSVAPELINYPYRSLRVTRLSEAVAVRRGCTVELHYDLLDLPHGEESSSTALLIHSIADPRERRRQLITAFPVEPDFLSGFLHPDRLGRRVVIRTRFNAHVPGITGFERYGRRWIEGGSNR